MFEPMVAFLAAYLGYALLIGAVVIAALFAILVVVALVNYGAIWFQAYMSGADVSLMSLIGMGFRPEHVETQDPTAAVAPASRILAQRAHPTALFCGNDAAAAGAVKAALALGIRVPQDLSVVGFDNAPWLGPVEIPLTTVSIPRRLLSAGAVDLLVDVVAGRAAADDTRILECDLLVRDTTAPAPDTG